MQQLTNIEMKLIRSLHRKKGRQESGFCLLEGQKLIDAAGSLLEFTFTKESTGQYKELITTDSPVDIAAVAVIPQWDWMKIDEKKTIVVLDGVQDPGNVGTIVRLCQAFNASVILIESADMTSPKVLRSTVGAFFEVPWKQVSRSEAQEAIENRKRPVYRLELTDDSQPIDVLRSDEQVILIAGSEGAGIHLPTEGTSVSIKHNDRLDSLNVANALAIALHERSR